MILRSYVAPLAFGGLLSLTLVTITSALDSKPQVKMSNSGLCHKAGGTYYTQTLNFQPYGSMAECLQSGGKEPLR